MALQSSLSLPDCGGVNHADFSIDGRYAIFTCEFAGTVTKIDMVNRKVLGYTQVIQPGRPTKVVVVRTTEDGLKVSSQLLKLARNVTQ
jgi:hypothetical protein